MDKRETEEEAEEMEDRDRGMGSIKLRCDVMYGRRQGMKGKGQERIIHKQGMRSSSPSDG